MEIITMDSDAFKRLMESINEIKRHLRMKEGPKKALQNDLVDTFEACRILGICRRTLERYRDSGDLPYSRIDRRLFYRVTDLEHLMQTRRQGFESGTTRNSH